MCGIIGVVLKDPSEKDFGLIKEIFRQSKIRGMHATGVSYIIDDKITTIKESVPSDEFVETHFTKLTDFVNVDGNLYLIGHCRYSTSDLEYNQPIFNEKFSIVHNGVISQELPENWTKLYGYDCSTKNDSELVLLSENPLEEFHSTSMAVCRLSIEKTLTFFRNGKRPAYYSKLENGYVITSTRDIAFRSGINNSVEMKMNQYNTIDSDVKMKTISLDIEGKDLQRWIYDR